MQVRRKLQLNRCKQTAHTEKAGREGRRYLATEDQLTNTIKDLTLRGRFGTWE